MACFPCCEKKVREKSKRESWIEKHVINKVKINTKKEQMTIPEVLPGRLKTVPTEDTPSIDFGEKIEMNRKRS